MNGNTKELIKYLLIIFVIWLLPIVMFSVGTYTISYPYLELANTLVNISVILIVLYLFVPIIFFKYATSKNMNKDIKGLLGYLLTIFVIGLLPIAIFSCGFGALDKNDDVSNLFFILAVILFILYFISPFIFTHRAITKHWSEYLDKFFNHKLYPTALLILFILFQVTRRAYYIGNIDFETLYGNIEGVLFIIRIGIVPIYYPIYLTNLCHRIYKFIKK